MQRYITFLRRELLERGNANCSYVSQWNEDSAKNLDIIFVGVTDWQEHYLNALKNNPHN